MAHQNGINHRTSNAKPDVLDVFVPLETPCSCMMRLRRCSPPASKVFAVEFQCGRVKS